MKITFKIAENREKQPKMEEKQGKIGEIKVILLDFR